MYACEEETILKRSKRSIGQLDASVTPSDICVPPPSHPNVSYPVELVANIEDNRQPEGEVKFYIHVSCCHFISFDYMMNAHLLALIS